MSFAPSKYQKAVFSELLNTTKNIVVSATAGCLHPETLVLLHNGLRKKAKDINVGDQLMGPDSLPRNVLNIKSGHSQLYKIIPQKGESWICNDKHILTVHNEYVAQSMKKYKNTTHTSPLQDVSIQKLLNVSKMTIAKGVKSEYISQYRLQRTAVEFETQQCNLDPYLMGLWLGDGSSTDSIIYSADDEIINYLQATIKNTAVVEDKKSRCKNIRLKCDNQCRDNHYRYEFKKAINEIGEKFIPRNYLINSREQRLKLLAGIIDTDGHVGKNCHLEFTLKSNALAEDLVFLCRSLGFGVITHKVLRGCQTGVIGEYNVIYVSGASVDIPTILPRKKIIQRLKCKSVLRSGIKIEDAGFGEWSGFQVDEDNRFLLGDFTITHNSGKTSTICEAVKLIDTSKDILLTAFNKSIVTELESRVPGNVICKTLHSIGISALMSHYRTTFKVSEYKISYFCDALLKIKEGEYEVRHGKKMSEKQKYSYKYTITDIINLTRVNMRSFDYDSVMNICERYELSFFDHEIEDAIEINSKLELYNQTFSKHDNLIDFVDMIYIPTTSRKIKLPQFDYIFLDEGQDANTIQQKLVEKMLKPGGRTIVVGDGNQCIYSFSGGDPESFKYFQNKPNTTVLPLSISYRCAKSIVRNAKLIYPDIEEFDMNKEGSVRSGSIDEIEEGDMVLCRNTKPLVFLYFMLITQGKPATIKGKDIEENIKKLISKMSRLSIEAGLEKLHNQLQVIFDELKAKGVKNPKNHPKYFTVYENVQILEILCKDCQHISDVEKKIENMFSDKEKTITLMTIHRSKGLESERVFYIESFEGVKLIPSPFATLDWQLEQENNLLFVCYTRAKSELIFINDL